MEAHEVMLTIGRSTSKPVSNTHVAKTACHEDFSRDTQGRGSKGSAAYFQRFQRCRAGRLAAFRGKCGKQGKGS